MRPRSSAKRTVWPGDAQLSPHVDRARRHRGRSADPFFDLFSGRSGCTRRRAAWRRQGRSGSAKGPAASPWGSLGSVSGSPSNPQGNPGPDRGPAGSPKGRPAFLRSSARCGLGWASSGWFEATSTRGGSSSGWGWGTSGWLSLASVGGWAGSMRGWATCNLGAAGSRDDSACKPGLCAQSHDHRAHDLAGCPPALCRRARAFDGFRATLGRCASAPARCHVTPHTCESDPGRCGTWARRRPSRAPGYGTTYFAGFLCRRDRFRTYDPYRVNADSVTVPKRFP
jgi:hypothetical protein